MLEERGQGVARVEIAAALLGIAEGEENLRGGEAAHAQQLLVGMGEADLADRGGSLVSSSSSGRLGSPSACRPSAMAPEETSTTSLPARARLATSSMSEASQARLRCPRGAVGEQRGADLDDDAARPVPLGADGGE